MPNCLECFSKFFPQRLKYILPSFLVLLFCAVSSTWGFTCHRETRGSLSFEISPIDPLSVEGQIYRAPLIIENKSETPISIKLVLSSIDSVYLYDESVEPPREVSAPDSIEKQIVVAAASTFKGDVAFTVRNAYVDAHYPIRAKFEYELDGNQEIVDLRPVFATKLTQRIASESKFQTLALDSNSYLKLDGARSQSYVPYWKQDKGKYNLLPFSWSGSENVSKATLNPIRMTRSGVQRSTWAIHPPYNGGPGVIGARFAVQLPAAKYISLRFFSAMRDVNPPEPPTDGVEFRVYASSLKKDSNGVAEEETLRESVDKQPDRRELVFADQYAGTDWKENNIDLSAFSGQTILLTLEADPGAKRNTTCDQSFWGDVVLIASDKPAQSIVDQKSHAQIGKVNLRAFAKFVKTEPQNIPASGLEIDDNSRGFDLDFGQYAVITLGQSGVFDGWITIGSKEKFVQIDGIRARYQDIVVGHERPFESCKVLTKFVTPEELEKTARLFAKAHNEEIIGDIPVDANLEGLSDITVEKSNANELLCVVSKTRGGLAFRVVSSHNSEISSLQFGPFSERATRVYCGHGHCIENPTKPFERSGDGFACSTSHVGFDFKNGLSLLQATTRPVDRLVVNPDSRVYSLTTTCDSRLTLRSSDKGAVDCAIKYAPGFDKAPALLVSKKAGKFVYDYWGSSYSNVLNRMKTYVAYGLTNTMLIQHVWQHYGYDVRLPDIWPPRSEQGSLEDLVETQNYLDQHGIPFGLHDNYIDFYPDADGFTYDDIIFEANGQPQKAWYNPGPDAQSYRFNPTKFMPYAKRNLDVVRKHLMQTAYFTDVFSSIHIMNFYDREGNFHPRTETVDAWNKYFDLVHESFNNNAITVSESGNDALIGHLDGADAILSRVSKVQENYGVVIPCEDNEFVPWSDAVNHKRFILHGVGYSSRYQGGESRAIRGIESDDYISSEVLTGHAIMADLGMSDRGTIRKYWLLQNLAEALALDEIVDFEFVDGNIHRQKITWKSGNVVYVNRDSVDWTPGLRIPNADAPVTLPRYGFWTTNGTSYGGIVKLDGQVVELRVDPEKSFFVNGRQKVYGEVVPIRPSFEDVNVDSSRQLTGIFVWDAKEPTAKSYAPFLHLERPKTWWNDKPELTVLPLPNPSKPTDKWNGRETDLFGKTLSIAISEDLQPGYYNLLCGLYDVKTGRRLPLLGSATEDSRYRLGGVKVEGKGSDRKLTFTPTPSLFGVDERLVPNVKPTNFGVCRSLGAFKLEKKSDSSFVLTPLPEEPAFEVCLSTSFFSNGSFDVVSKDIDGVELANESASAKDGVLTLTLDASKAFSYEVTKR